MARLAECKTPFLKQEFGLAPSASNAAQRPPTTPEPLDLSFQKGLVCVLMPFQAPEMDATYQLIEDACRSCELTPLRADKLSGSGTVMRDIEKMMSLSEIVIVDLSYERPNVYYELGYVHGIGNTAHNVLLIAKVGTPLHFDIAPLRIHSYESADHLRTILSDSLRSMMAFTRDRNAQFATPTVKSVLAELLSYVPNMSNRPSSPPNQADKIGVACKCGHRGMVQAEWAGRKVKCPKCQGKTIVRGQTE